MGGDLESLEAAVKEAAIGGLGPAHRAVRQGRRLAEEGRKLRAQLAREKRIREAEEELGGRVGDVREAMAALEVHVTEGRVRFAEDQDSQLLEQDEWDEDDEDDDEEDDDEEKDEEEEGRRAGGGEEGASGLGLEEGDEVQSEELEDGEWT